jgi:hypothetical protein
LTAGSARFETPLLAGCSQKRTFPFLEPTSNLAAVLRELSPEKAGKGSLLRPDLEGAAGLMLIGLAKNGARRLERRNRLNHHPRRQVHNLYDWISVQ